MHDENGFFISSVIISPLMIVSLAFITGLPLGISFITYHIGGYVIYEIKKDFCVFDQGDVWARVYLPVLFWPLAIIVYFFDIVFPLKKIKDEDSKKLARMMMVKNI